MIKSKLLSDAGWKDVAAKGKVKDNGLLKALEKLKRLADDEHDETIKVLDEIGKLAGLLKKDKAVAAVPAAAKYIAEMLSEVLSVSRDVAKAKAEHDKAHKAKAEAEKKAAKAADDEGDEEEEESPELLTTKLKPLLKLVNKGVTMHALLAKSGKKVVVMLSRKPISPSRRKMLFDQLGGGSTKYYPGTCSREAGSTTFTLKSEVAGMAKLVKLALLEQTGLRLNKIKCRGDDGDDSDNDEGGDEGDDEAHDDGAPVAKNKPGEKSPVVAEPPGAPGADQVAQLPTDGVRAAPGAPTPMLQSLKIKAASAKIPLGSTLQLEVIGLYGSYEQDETKAVQWESRSPDVISVDADGIATAHALGKAMLLATEPNSKVGTSIDVLAVPAKWPESLTILPADPQVHSTDFVQFEVTANFSDRTSGPLAGPHLSWQSSDEKVLTIDKKTGKGMGRHGGKAVVKATWFGWNGDGNDTTVEAKTNASVPSIVSVAVDTANPVMLVGEERRLKAWGVYSDGSRRERAQVKWTSTNPSALFIDANGLAIGRQAGNAPVMVVLNDPPGIPPGTGQLTVKEPVVTELKLRFDNPGFKGELVRGERLQFFASGDYPVGSGKVLSRDLPNVLWTSSDPKVIDIKGGLATALKAGPASISAQDRASGIEVSLSLRVTEPAAAPAGDPKAVPPAVAQPYQAAQKGYDSLMLQVRELDGVPKMMKSLDAIIADLSKAKEDTVTKAQMTEQQNQQVQGIQLQVNSFQRHAEAAKTHMQRADEELALQAMSEEVAELRKRGAEEVKNLDFVLSLFKATVGAVASSNPAVAIAEVVSGATKRFGPNAWFVAAEKLQRKLDARRDKLLLAYISDAKQELKNAETSLKEANSLSTKAVELFNHLRAELENKFDTGAGAGSFKFAQLVKPLAMADKIVDTLAPAVQRDAAAASAAIKTSPAGPTLSGMNDKALGWWKQAATVSKQADEQRRRLRDLRQQANTKLAFVKPGAKAGKP